MSVALRFASSLPRAPRRVLPKRRLWLWLYANRPRPSRAAGRASRKPSLWHKGRPLKPVFVRMNSVDTERRRRTRRAAPKFR